MPEREIKVSAAYYTNTDGHSVLGFQGDKVDVSSETVKRFDDLNVLPESFIDDPGHEDEALLVYPGDAGVDTEKPKPRGRPRKAESD
jgi:hypothetical protein